METALPGTLSPGQFSLVYNMLSLAIASMLGSFAFFVMARSMVSAKYRPALVMSALVVGIAGYHYLRIFNSWEGAYELNAAGVYASTGHPFNDAYRYVDWLLTVPLLVAELIAVMALEANKRRTLMTRLSFAAVLMIALGYPGEVLASGDPMKHVWGVASSIPFGYIVYVLWTELGTAVQGQSGRVQELVRNIKLLLLATWGFYPITYLLGAGGILPEDGSAIVTIQVGYSIADILAKCGYGVMIYLIARAKMDADGEVA